VTEIAYHTPKGMQNDLNLEAVRVIRKLYKIEKRKIIVDSGFQIDKSPKHILLSGNPEVHSL
jgi:hypothetical protein